MPRSAERRFIPISAWTRHPRPMTPEGCQKGRTYPRMVRHARNERRILHPGIERGIPCRQNPSAVLSAPEDQAVLRPREEHDEHPADKKPQRIHHKRTSPCELPIPDHRPGDTEHVQERTHIRKETSPFIEEPEVGSVSCRNTSAGDKEDSEPCYKKMKIKVSETTKLRQKKCR